jgi:hypothetical protein
MVAKEIKPPHRGRFQAQGGGVEKSVSWAQNVPPTVSDGHQWLDNLIAQLSPAEYLERLESFRKAREFMERAAKCGGVNAAISKSWVARGTIRVDLEVWVGTAFVPNPDK